jgi:glucose-6-phosphate isomerase
VWQALQQSSADNPAVSLAVALSDSKRDIALLLADEELVPGLGDWIEQLVAESTGKNGKGVLPVVAAPPAPESEAELADVVSIALSPSQASGADVTVNAPLGAQFLLWEYATAFCGVLLTLNPFDQPDVESAKVAARGLLDKQPQPTPADVTVDGVQMWFSAGLSSKVSSTSEAWESVRSALTPSGYVAVHLYADRLAHPDTSAARAALARALGRPVTIGFGPRFLHSTGQFHKGGTPDGVFVQVIVEPQATVEIPGYPFDFGTLVNAQAMGDRDVLISRGRPVLTVRLGNEDALVAFLSQGGRLS